MTDNRPEPRTEAGRRMLHRRSYWSGNNAIREAILAIEAEAAQGAAHLPPCPICLKPDLFIGKDGLPGCPHCEVAVRLPIVIEEDAPPPMSPIEWSEGAAPRAEGLDVREAVKITDDRHQSALDIGRIIRAVAPRYSLYGLWVQYHGDGTNRASKGEVVVSIQYGWSGDRRAEEGRGSTIREATSDLLARLTPQERRD